MISLARRVLPLGEPPVSRERALEIARRECDERGWQWVEPVEATERLRHWEVLTRARSRGANVRVHVSKRDGTVLLATQSPR